MIKVGNIYKYKELCELMNEKVKNGNAKKAQLTNWKRFFNWTNPTTQTYLITEIYDIPKEKNNNWGGARKGSGAKTKMQEEFDYIFRMFLYENYRRNEYFRDVENWYEVYFNNNTICKFFGCYKDIYSALSDETANQIVVKKVSEKIREKSRSWIFSKIDKVNGITLSKGILVKKIGSKHFERQDDLLEQFNEYQQEFLDQQGIKNIGDISDDSEMWAKMEQYIKDRFENKYSLIKKMHKVCFSSEYTKGELNTKVYIKHRNNFNKAFIDNIYDFFVKKVKEAYIDDLIYGIEFDEEKEMKDYQYIIDEYLKVA